MTPLSDYVRILGRGPGRSRALTFEEAQDAMGLMLQPDCAPEAIGALLMLMRFRGESAPEIAGFTQALRDRVSDWSTVPAALDWPSYAAGRTRGAPYFLLAAKLVAQAGHPVILHGWNSHQNPVANVRAALETVNIPVANTPKDATGALERTGVVYAPAEYLDGDALRLLKLRDVLGLRSCLNTCWRMLNPTRATAMVQGVFHPSYRDLQSDAAQLLGDPALGVIKGGGGEFERHPSKLVSLYGVKGSVAFEDLAPPLAEDTRRLNEGDGPDIASLWFGDRQDAFAAAVVTGTAALALYTLGAAPTLAEAQCQADHLWTCRHTARAA